MSTDFIKLLKKFDIYTFRVVIVIYLYIHFERKFLVVVFRRLHSRGAFYE